MHTNHSYPTFRNVFGDKVRCRLIMVRRGISGPHQRIYCEGERRSLSEKVENEII